MGSSSGLIGGAFGNGGGSSNGTVEAGGTPSTEPPLAGGADATGGASVAGGGADVTGGSPSGGDSSTTEPAAGGTSGSSSTLPAAGGAPTNCAMGASPCDYLPRFTGDQTVDGLGDELCSVPGFTLDFASAAKVVEYNGHHDLSSYKESATVHAAWSTSHVHVFVRVRDDDIVPANSIDSIWNADGIDFFISSNNLLTGSTATDLSAMHLIVSPGFGTAKGLGAIAKTSGTTGTQSALPAEQYYTRQDAEGYSVELRVPWPPGAAPAAGATVRVDISLNSAGASVTGDNPRDALAIYYLKTTGLGTQPSPCGTATTSILPYCDDRSWCSSVLQ